MEVETAWSPSLTVVSISDSEEMDDVWVEEIVIEEDGSPAESQWNVDDVLTLSSSGSVKSLNDPDSSSDLTAPLGDTSPIYVLPDSLTKEEDNLLEESFELMEDLMAGKDVSFRWKEESGAKTVLEKAQELLDHLDETKIKQEPFSEWLEEKMELPLLEELSGYVNGVQSRPGLLPASVAAVPYQPRPLNVATPHVGQVAPHLDFQTGLSLLSSGTQVDLSDVSAHVPVVSSEVEQPPLTPALIREFETVLHQTLTPPRTPPTYIDLVNSQKEENKAGLAEEELDALIYSQVASLYDDDKLRSKEWPRTETRNSPNSDWGSGSTSNATEDSDSACLSSSESDPDWAPSETLSRGNSSRNRRAISSVEERKERKKEQNKNAATRYRLKKKAEQAGIVGEEGVLLEKNIALKDQATELQREIKYLKSLMRDICKAKGLIQ